MKRVLLTGANGLLGQALIWRLKGHYTLLATGVEPHPELPPDGWEYRQLDITSASDAKDLVYEFLPDYIVNAASYTNVDGCEKEKELCWRVNVKGVEILARLARRKNAHFIHYSTDYIFDGQHGPYAEDDRPDPVGYYGKSKLASENITRQTGCRFTILRTCVLYGLGRNVKQNFFLWVYHNLKNKNPIRVVTDQYNNPTLAEDLANATDQVIRLQAEGIYHIAGNEYLNRYEFAVAIARAFGFDTQLITPITTEELNQPAPRPPLGGLKIDRARKELNYHPHSIEDSLNYLKMKLEKNGAGK